MERDNTYPCPRAFIESRGVALAYRSHLQRLRKWYWLLYLIGWVEHDRFPQEHR